MYSNFILNRQCSNEILAKIRGVLFLQGEIVILRYWTLSPPSKSSNRYKIIEIIIRHANINIKLKEKNKWSKIVAWSWISYHVIISCFTYRPEPRKQKWTVPARKSFLASGCCWSWPSACQRSSEHIRR